MIQGTTACSSTQFSAAVWHASKDCTVGFNRFEAVARKFLRSPNGACNYGRAMKQHLLTRSCLCKRVKYSVAAELPQFFLCHCEQCRKVTGSAFASNIQAAPAEVKWLAGAEYVKRFDYPGDRLFTKVFCSECGSGLPFLNKTGKKLFIPAGSLDSEPGILPGHNIFWGDRSSWYEAGVSAPRSE